MSRWPVDWAIALVAPVLIEKGVSAGYGYKHASRSIFYPASPWGDLEVVLAYLSQNEAYEDIAEYLATELSGSIPVGLATTSVRTRLHTENTTGFPSLSDAMLARKTPVATPRATSALMGTSRRCGVLL